MLISEWQGATRPPGQDPTPSCCGSGVPRECQGTTETWCRCQCWKQELLVRYCIKRYFKARTSFTLKHIFSAWHNSFCVTEFRSIWNMCFKTKNLFWCKLKSYVSVRALASYLQLIKIQSYKQSVLELRIFMEIWAASRQNQQNDCAPIEDSDQPGHLPSLIRVFAVRMMKAWTLSYPLSAQRRLWSDWADAQTDLSLRWVHSHFVGFVMSRLIWYFQFYMKRWRLVTPS